MGTSLIDAVKASAKHVFDIIILLRQLAVGIFRRIDYLTAKTTFLWRLLSLLLSVFANAFGCIDDADANIISNNLSISILRSEIPCFFGHHVSFALVYFHLGL